MMRRMRGAVSLAVAMATGLAGAGCGGGGGIKSDGGGAGAGGGAAGAGGGGAGGTGGGAMDAAVDHGVDLATDFGIPASDVVVRCPTAAGTLAPAAAALIIDDFDGVGRLDGRQRGTSLFTVKEQFDATASATFDPVPSIEGTCGAAGPGAAHIRGRAADTGATFSLVFSTPVEGGKAIDHYDASATTGISFRVALGDAKASKILSLQVNLAQSQWDYTRDVSVTGTTWQEVRILWGELQAAPAAPAFSAAGLNQLVFPFFPDADVDVYIDDLAFVK
jgi:hypothetical protein